MSRPSLCIAGRRCAADRAPHRAGFTLPELLLSLVLFGLVMTVGMRVLVQQQRFHRGASAVTDMRSQLRHAVFALPVELRSISPAGGDVYDWSASAIEFRSNLGSGTLCVKPTSTTIVLPPLTLAQQNALTSWISVPQAGDSILIYDENVEIGNDDDVWRRHEITAISTVTGASACPAASGYTLAADATKSSWQLTISPALSGTIVLGAPIRFFRRVRYELYQEADTRWYLGASDCVTGRTPVCTSAVPVAGPYRPFSGSPTLSGFVLTYFDSVGVTLDPASDDAGEIARIHMVIRGETETPFDITSATGTYRDSLSFVVGVRNRD